MDAPEVRRELVRQFRLSDSAQIERGGVIFKDDLTGNYFVEYSPASYPPTQCRFDIQRYNQPGYTQVAIWHTHPAKNTVLTNCPDRPPGSRTGEGPSKGPDFKAQAAVNPLPAYVMDRDDIYRITNNPSTGFWSAFKDAQRVMKNPWKACANWVT